MRLPTRSSFRSTFFPCILRDEIEDAYSRSDLTLVVRHLRIVSRSLISASCRARSASCDVMPCRLVEKPIAAIARSTVTKGAAALHHDNNSHVAAGIAVVPNRILVLFIFYLSSLTLLHRPSQTFRSGEGEPRQVTTKVARGKSPQPPILSYLQIFLLSTFVSRPISRFLTYQQSFFSFFVF